MAIRKNKTRKDRPESTVVDVVREQTEQAAALAAIGGQDRLGDPTWNPATRPHADQLRKGQQIKALDAENSRKLRRLRVEDSRAAEAEETLQAIALARRAQSPARSVRELHVSRRRYTRLSLAASVVLAVGSAMGVEAAASALHAPAGSGYVAEIGLTGLATAAISYRAHLAEHRGKLARGSWQSKALWALMTVPLLVSVATNIAMLNVVGAFCAVGAAAFALLGVVTADRSAAAMQDRAAEVSEHVEQELVATAMGEDLFAPVTVEAATGPGEGSVATAALEAPAPPRLPAAEEAAHDDHDFEDGAQDDVADDPAGESVDDIVNDVADGADWSVVEGWLNPPEAGASASEPPAPDGGPAGAARGLPGRRGRTAEGHDDDRTRRDDQGNAGEGAVSAGGHIDSDMADVPGWDGAGLAGSDRTGEPEDPGANRVQPAVEARLAAGEETRAQIAAYKAKHPKATQKEVARALGISVATVKRHQRKLRDGGER